MINLTSLQCDDDDNLGVWFPPCGEGNEEDGVYLLTSTKAGELVTKEEKKIEEESDTDVETRHTDSSSSSKEGRGSVILLELLCLF